MNLGLCRISLFVAGNWLCLEYSCHKALFVGEDRLVIVKVTDRCSFGMAGEEFSLVLQPVATDIGHSRFCAWVVQACKAHGQKSILV